MLEPDVTLSDMALAVQSIVFCGLLLRRRAGDAYTNRLFAALFAALGCSSLMGGIWHGFFSDLESGAGRWVWFTTMFALALATTALWHVAANLMAPGRRPTMIRRFAFAQLFVQTLVSAFVTDAFAVGAVGMLPALVLNTVMYIRLYRAKGSPRVLSGIAGFCLAAVSGLVIVFDVSLHSLWATPNTVFHILQFVAFGLVFISVPSVAAQPR